MTKDFYEEYLNRGAGIQRLLCTMNPEKFKVCKYLIIQHHHKVIVFSDDIYALRKYCEHLDVELIDGSTSEAERTRILETFKKSTHNESSKPNARLKAKDFCIGLSRVGDTALDIPEANVIIQVSSHFGSRKQEAQRLGRILRPKPNPNPIGGYDAFFYTLVSADTRDMFFSTKRQQYLIDQGYTYTVVQDLLARVEHGSADYEEGLLKEILSMKDNNILMAEEVNY
jgi:DNA excision repair protein ERCC-3